jgi:hypothetical protein
MAQSGYPRRDSFGGAIILIALGVFLLLWNIRPGFNPWLVLERYWPLILIFIGVGKMWDSYEARRHPDSPRAGGISGVAIALLILVALFGVAVWHGRTAKVIVHDTHSVDREAATSVSANIEMPAGKLILEGGSPRLLDADFDYDEAEGRPSVEYSVSGDRGQLNVSQDKEHTHFGRTHNDWYLRFSNELPLDLDLNLGAGQGDLRLRGMNVTRLGINIGAGQLDLDLTGPRKTDLDATIHGGVGKAKVRLSRDIGVQVYASGGIGSIEAHGLRREGGAYVNEAYGKTPATIKMTVEGGIGEIDLQEEP